MDETEQVIFDARAIILAEKGEILLSCTECREEMIIKSFPGVCSPICDTCSHRTSWEFSIKSIDLLKKRDFI